MISSELSDIPPCPICGSRQVWRVIPYPVLIQVIFGLSFILFLVFFNTIRYHSMILWAWCGVQIILGFLLIKKRIQTKKKILRCIRCTTALR